LAPQDVAAQAKIMAGNPSWGPNSICITAAFTPGSISLSAFELSVAGFEWGRKVQDVMANPVVSRCGCMVTKEDDVLITTGSTYE
jgi:pre-mRNA-processing factor 8